MQAFTSALSDHELPLWLGTSLSSYVLGLKAPADQPTQPRKTSLFWLLSGIRAPYSYQILLNGCHLLQEFQLLAQILLARVSVAAAGLAENSLAVVRLQPSG